LPERSSRLSLDAGPTRLEALVGSRDVLRHVTYRISPTGVRVSSALVAPTRVVLADLLPGALARDALLVAGAAGLTGLAAQISFVTPLSPVPFTLQTLTVLVAGAALGSVRGVLSMLLYLAAGMAGLPWFAGHKHGFGGPAFGYLIGFVLAAALVGALARRGADRRVAGTVMLMAAGSLVVYAVGTVWLAQDLDLGLVKAFDLGVRPFLATDAIKVGIAALAFPVTWRLVRSDRRG
jgi:biotin transport system substrate-specific component